MTLALWAVVVALLAAVAYLWVLLQRSEAHLSAARAMIVQVAPTAGPGLCPVRAPGAWGGHPPSHCLLRAGHSGDHENGTERWNTSYYIPTERTT